MTQSAIRIHPAPMTKNPSKAGAGKANAKQSRPKQSAAQQGSTASGAAKAYQPQQQAKAAKGDPAKPNPDARKVGVPGAGTTMSADKTPGPEAQTPSDVITNAAAKAQEGKTVMFASMRAATAPYLEKHSHTVLYGIVGFVAAALILIVGFWPTVLLAVFAAVGVVIGRYRYGDQKTRERMKGILERISS